MRKLSLLYKFLAVLLLIISVNHVTAQTFPGCGTPKPTGEAKLVPADYQRPTDITGMRMIKLYVTVTRAEWQNAPPAQTEENIMAHFELMRQQFAPHGICFILGGISEVVSDDLAYIDADDPDDFALVDAYANARPDGLNVFIHNDIAGNVLGTAWAIPNNFVSLEGGYVWGEFAVLASHEIGHALGLFHTFETYYGKELVARNGNCSNCGSAGDLICDTEADKDITTAYFGDNCNYIGNHRDSCDNKFLMEPSNSMSYNFLTACRYLMHFSPGQANRMHYTINTTPFLQTTLLLTNSFTLTNTINYTSGNYSFTYRNNYTINSPSYQVTGATRMQVSSEEIILRPGATLSPTTGMVVLRANLLCQ